MDFNAILYVIKLGLAGSVARGESTHDSDIDIIVSLDSSNTFRSFFGLLHFLQDSLPHKIDLATESSLKPIVKKQIMKDIRYV
jgi:hypothetical protein